MSSRSSAETLIKGLTEMFRSQNAGTLVDDQVERDSKRPTFPSQHKPKFRRKKRVAQRKHHVFSLDLEEIFAVTQEHEKYGDGRMKLKGLSRFDDCSAYGISDDAHKHLVRREISKLAEAATREGPYLFESEGSFLKGSLDDFEDAESIMDQIACNLAIITHDNAQIGMWNTNGRLLEDNISAFKDSRKILLARFGGADDTVEGAEPLILEPPERNRTLYHALCDYSLHCVARLVLRSATSERWVKYSLAVLALWAVKLKLIAYDPTRYAQLSISSGEDVVDRLAEMHGSKRLVFLKVNVKKPDGKGNDEEKEVQHDTLNSDTSLKTFYYETHLFFRRDLRYLLKCAVWSILDDKNLQKGISNAAFEACTLVYSTGLEGVVTAVDQDRCGCVAFSSEPTVISHLYGGLLLLRTNVEAIHLRNRDMLKSEASPLGNVGATVKWSCRSGNKDDMKDQTTYLYSMEDILSVAVTQSLATLSSADCVKGMLRTVASGSSKKDPILPFSPPPKSLQAMFHIISEDYLRNQRLDQLQQLEDRDVHSIPYSPLRHGIRAGTNLKEEDMSNAASKTEEHARQILTEYKRHTQKMDAWIIAEDSITINCQIYVISIISIAVIIVCGSLSVPFAVRNRIGGVDPFQFVTFTWVLMAFFVLVAKSLYVSDWSWHHFLHGKVVCKSVSDVRDVSGIDAQMILMKLLHGERENILTTRGPYNGMFTRRSKGLDGFSINTPVKLSTMLASGFIVFKIADENGEHLICGDVRKGTEVGEFEADSREKSLGYKNLDIDASDETSDDETSSQYSNERAVVRRNVRDKASGGKIHLLREEEFGYKKMLGIYVHDSLFG
ncbi:MAG: hypothetical protein M1820_002981 [Bogoriella megaspora]|nr:MAG: hypothetical protein M1820_002981 [Bogoriella megaspora]